MATGFFAGIWRPAALNWSKACAILTIVANAEIAPCHDRQMVVLTRDQRMGWLNGLSPKWKSCSHRRPGPSGLSAMHARLPSPTLAI